jgi:uncharacterized protein YfeS
MALPEAHPAFAAHFTDPIYESQGEEFAPFASDEGWELVMDWGDRRDELAADATLTRVLGTEDLRNVAGAMEGVDGIETAMFITSAAFVLLRLVGRIDDDDRALALEALEFQLAQGNGEPVLERQRTDLAAWRNPS